MGGQEIGRARIDASLAGRRLELGVASHGREEAHRAVGIIAGTRRDPDADAVSFQLLCARETGKLDLGLGERQRAGFGITAQVREHALDQRDLAGLVLAHGGMAGDHM